MRSLPIRVTRKRSEVEKQRVRETTHSDGKKSSVWNSEGKEKSSGDHNMLLPFYFTDYFLNTMAGYCHNCY